MVFVDGFEDSTSFFCREGLKGQRKILWVWWLNICKPKSEGGLGIRDLRSVKLSLLWKWHWMLIIGGGSEWVWDIKWMVDLFEWELVILGELLMALESPTFSESVDFWVWSNDSSSIYSVRSTYKFLHMRASVVDERST